MSIEALNWALKLPLKNSGAKFVLVVIANYADEHGQCFPSQEKLSERTGICKRQVIEHIKFLETAGYISIEKRRAAGGEFYSNVYQMRNPHPAPNADSADRPNADSAPYTKDSYPIYKEQVENFDFPLKPLLTVFPYLIDKLTPAQIGSIESEVKPADALAWAETIEHYRLNFDPGSKRYLPEKVANLLETFRSKRDQAAAKKNLAKSLCTQERIKQNGGFLH